MKPASPDRITAYGAHLLAIEYHRHARFFNATGDKDIGEHHTAEAEKMERLSAEIREGNQRYIPIEPDHDKAYQRAIKELKP